MTAPIDSPNRAQKSRSAARIRRRVCPAPHITACKASPSAPVGEVLQFDLSGPRAIAQESTGRAQGEELAQQVHDAHQA